jgi:hypothetical protein
MDVSIQISIPVTYQIFARPPRIKAKRMICHSLAFSTCCLVEDIENSSNFGQMGKDVSMAFRFRVRTPIKSQIKTSDIDYLVFERFSFPFVKAKPPNAPRSFTKDAIFSKMPYFEGGLTFVRTYCRQPPKHPHCMPKHV